MKPLRSGHDCGAEKWWTTIGIIVGLTLGTHGAVAQSSMRAPEAAAKTAVAFPGWIYQLQGDLARVRQSPADIAVVDIDHVKSNGGVASLRRRLKAAPRVVLSYLSIGEAESSRPWWQTCCVSARPSWLTDKTQGWRGDFLVRYWDKGWQQHIEQQLTAVIAAGYDGVYLDRVDSWEAMVGERSRARADMIEFVGQLVRSAKAKKPGFLVFVQNGEELLEDSGYLKTIDGIAKEDLFYGARKTGTKNPTEMIRHSVSLLDRVRRQGKPVLVVEYLPSGSAADTVRSEVDARGYRLTFADRALSGGSEPSRAGEKSAAGPATGTTVELTTGMAAGATTSPVSSAPIRPTTWTPAEIEAAQTKCAAALKGLNISWERVDPMRNGDCGTPAPIRVKKVGGVELRPASIVNCAMAAALVSWVDTVLRPAAIAHLAGPPTHLDVASSYQCRDRVGGHVAKLSEHAFANAIDISTFSTPTQTASVQGNWGTVKRLEAPAHVKSETPSGGPKNSNTRDAKTQAAQRNNLGVPANSTAIAAGDASLMSIDKRAFLHRVHQQSCGLFGTVLGPEANDAHLAHLHLDLALRKRTAYCQ